MIGAEHEPSRGVSGFFARIFFALMLVNLTTTGALVYIAYSYSSETLSRHARENIEQQISVLAERFHENQLRNLSRSLRSLVGSAEIDDYLHGSRAERLVLQRRIERHFKRYWQDFPELSELRFIDDNGVVAVGLVNGRRVTTRGGKAQIDQLPTQAREVYRTLEETPLLLSSGNMEWFLPPREMRLSEPFLDDQGNYALYAGRAKLDSDTGLFGGAMLLRVELQAWLDDLSQLRFFSEALVWVLSANGNVLLAPEDKHARIDLQALLASIDDDPESAPGGLIAHRELTLPSGEPLLTLAIAVPEHLLLRELRPVLNFFTLVLLISAAVLAAVSFLISRYLSRPVLELAVARNQLANAHRIARLGHWEWDIDADNLVFSENVLGILDLAVPETGIPMKRFVALIHHADRDGFRAAIEECRTGESATSVEYRVRHRSGFDQFLHQEIDLIAGERRRLVGTIQDISERKRSEAQIRELAYFDTVTGLANRRSLIEIGGEALERMRMEHGRMAMLFLDLDHFKHVNDTLGHDAGDELLRQVALRLSECARPQQGRHLDAGMSADDNLVARLGGDEFVILLPDIRTAAEAVRVAEHVCASLTVPFGLDGREVTATGSVGVSQWPEHGDGIDEMLRHADAAMYHAKSKGRNRYEIYTEAIEREVQRRVSMEARLRRAIEHGEFHLHYQPRIRLADGHVASVEALIRWNDPDHGAVTPDQFIPLAEECGLIMPIGEWVLATACRQLAIWHADWPELSISVNLSPVQFASANLPASIAKAADGVSLERRLVELELTENALFSDVGAGVRLARELKSLGFGLSIDDFGTGYSSLQMLRQLPVDALKIDRSFIRDLLIDDDDAVIVRTAIGLGKSLGLKVVGEGVEEQGQLDTLRSWGCDEAQGFLIGCPMAAEDIEALLRRERSLTAVP